MNFGDMIGKVAGAYVTSQLGPIAGKATESIVSDFLNGKMDGNTFKDAAMNAAKTYGSAEIAQELREASDKASKSGDRSAAAFFDSVADQIEDAGYSKPSTNTDNSTTDSTNSPPLPVQQVYTT